MDSDLYPDLTVAGGLAAALELRAAELGVDLTVTLGDRGRLTSAGIVSSVPERKPLSVRMQAESRSFGVSGWSHGVELITGATASLDDIVMAGAAWGRGAGLQELREMPFLHITRRGEAHERGPAAVVDLQWRSMREQAAGELGFAGFGELVEAAQAEPRLRQLYVYSSHWTLGFSSCTGYPFRDEVAIAPSYKGSPFRVRKHPLAEGVLGEAATAQEAVALAVSHLPADLGPAVTGTSEQDD
ncbi:DUF6193 family natural product biosynthesis protein [Streptomyces sp. NPDC055055]